MKKKESIENKESTTSQNVTIKPLAITNNVMGLIKITQQFIKQSQTDKMSWFTTKEKDDPSFSVKVVGSFVYKQLLRSEKAEDLDIVTDDVPSFARAFVLFVPDAYCGLKEDLGTSGSMMRDFSAIFFRNRENLKMDVMCSKEFFSRTNETGLNVTNALVYNIEDESLKHVFEIKEIADQLDLQATDAKAERKWVIDQIKNKRYCRWWGMRPKDKKYFSDWTVLDESQCNAHGMFSKKI